MTRVMEVMYVESGESIVNSISKHITGESVAILSSENTSREIEDFISAPDSNAKKVEIFSATTKVARLMRSGQAFDQVILIRPIMRIESLEELFLESKIGKLTVFERAL